MNAYFQSTQRLKLYADSLDKIVYDPNYQPPIVKDSGIQQPATEYSYSKRSEPEC